MTCSFSTENGTAVTVWNTGLKPGFQQFDEICGKAEVSDPNKPGELSVSFETRNRNT
jgi:lipocalin